jgi:hypothetical protein
MTFRGGRGDFIAKTFGAAFEEPASTEKIFLFLATCSSLEAPLLLFSGS